MSDIKYKNVSHYLLSTDRLSDVNGTAIQSQRSIRALSRLVLFVTAPSTVTVSGKFTEICGLTQFYREHTVGNSPEHRTEQFTK